jgi:hypothetical protein
MSIYLIYEYYAKHIDAEYGCYKKLLLYVINN